MFHSEHSRINVMGFGFGYNAEIRPRLKKPDADTKGYISGLRVRNGMRGRSRSFLVNGECQR